MAAYWCEQQVFYRNKHVFSGVKSMSYTISWMLSGELFNSVNDRLILEMQRYDKRKKVFHF